MFAPETELVRGLTLDRKTPESHHLSPLESGERSEALPLHGEGQVNKDKSRPDPKRPGA